MAKGQTKQATQMSKDVYGQAPAQFQPIISGLGTQQAQTGQFQQDVGQAAKAGFTAAQTTGGYDPTQLAGLRSKASQFTETGGYDPTQLANITGGYQNFATTGGYTPEQEAAFINQATSGVGSTYDVLQDQMRRKIAAQGGIGGGETAQLARNMGEAVKSADLGAVTQIKQIEDANKLAGLGGEAQLASDVAAKKQAGFGAQAGLESNVAAGSLAGTRGLEGLYDTSTGQLTAQGNQLLNAVNSMFGVQLNSTQLMQALSKNPGLFQTIMGDIGTVGGAAAGVMGGLGGLGMGMASGAPFGQYTVEG